MTKERKQALITLLLLVPAPTLGTLAGVWLPATSGTVFGQIVYFLSKIWLLALPLLWLKWIGKERFSLSPLKNGGLGMGLATGLLLGGVIFLTWYFIGESLIDPQFFRSQIEKVGIGSKGRYLFICLYITLVNSLLEEYVWRWFVFRKCEILMGSKPAVLASGLFFTIHHVFALDAYFNWKLTVLGSLGVFMGGISWSWLYQKYRSVWPGYLSHVIVDAVILGIGGFMIFFQAV